MDELPPEVKQQLEEQKKNCPFCKIISGEIPSKKVYEDSLLSAILDINPCTKGHVLLMPQEHYPIMPLIPPQTFKHMFGYLPSLIKALKDATLTTGANAVIANGGVAGQQSPHFMVHLIPREKGDQLEKFNFIGKKLDDGEVQQTYQMLAQNLPIMMKNHFSKNPPQWKNSNEGHQKEHLKEIPSLWKIYEDEKTIAVLPKESLSPGHIKIYSKDEKTDIENIDFETASHLFYVASFSATAVFEGLKAHGSNIILKTGISDDNPDGTLQIHVLPRYENDGLDLMNKPMEKKPDMDDISSKIKEQMFYVEHKAKGLDKKPNKIQINLDEENKKTKIYGDIDNNNKNNINNNNNSDNDNNNNKTGNNIDDNKNTKRNEENHLEEIRQAIQRLKK